MSEFGVPEEIARAAVSKPDQQPVTPGKVIDLDARRPVADNGVDAATGPGPGPRPKEGKKRDGQPKLPWQPGRRPRGEAEIPGAAQGGVMSPGQEIGIGAAVTALRPDAGFQQAPTARPRGRRAA